MRKILIITGITGISILIASCGGPRRNPGHTYMPDMAYSRAYETYAGLDTSIFTTERNGWGSTNKIFYNHQPVSGAVARGEMAAYTIPNDTIGYKLSAAVTNPLNPSEIDMKEAERLYLVNCGICHGAKLDGNGPLWKDGSGPYPAAPKNLLGADMVALPEGTMFHSVTYGRNQMGSYASQMSTQQRWMVVAFVKNKQGAGKATTDSTAAAVTPVKADSTAATTTKM